MYGTETTDIHQTSTIANRIRNYYHAGTRKSHPATHPPHSRATQTHYPRRTARTRPDLVFSTTIWPVTSQPISPRTLPQLPLQIQINYQISNSPYNSHPFTKSNTGKPFKHGEQLHQDSRQPRHSRGSRSPAADSTHRTPRPRSASGRSRSQM